VLAALDCSAPPTTLHHLVSTHLSLIERGKLEEGERVLMRIRGTQGALAQRCVMCATARPSGSTRMLSRGSDLLRPLPATTHPLTPLTDQHATLTHTHTHARTRTHARTHTHTHINKHRRVC
jgi:hypothetical protein